MALGCCSVSTAQFYTPVDNGSAVIFKINNFGWAVEGSFKGLQGTIKFDPENLNNSSFDVSVNSSSIDTGIGLRDKHLRKQEYFDVERFPFMRFISATVEKSPTPDVMIITGTLTIKNVTKEIFFQFKAIEKKNDYIFEGAFSINRKDFKVGGNSVSLSDSIKVNLLVFAKKRNGS